MKKEEITEIAENLDSGFKCYVHFESKKLLFIPDQEQFYDMDMELAGEEIEELENNFDSYIEVRKPDSHNSFEFMAEFIETVGDPTIKGKLEQAINGAKPFRNFKIQIDSAGLYRNAWFNFKLAKMIEYVEQELKQNELL